MSVKNWIAWSRGALAASVAALGFLCAVDVFDIPFDYYRFVGGDAYRRAVLQSDANRRKELLRKSVAAYRKANRYAPAGRDRIGQQERSERLLREMSVEP